MADLIPATTYTTDIDNQAAGNYTYDKIGNLVKDNAEGISAITWTVYGKIDKITKTDGTAIQYTYDATENRISKAVTKAGQTATTFYVRDAQGNTMAVYEQNSTLNSGHFTLSEQHLYGSSRLGIYNPGKDLTLPANTPVNLGSNQTAALATFERGKKFFELSNHLGNVLVTISDKKIGVDAGADGKIDYYTAVVVSANDYYPFGMQMPGRNYNAGTYRYGFNGKEFDNEPKSLGNQIDYGERMYDPRVGRFLSVDPLTKSYPQYSPYQYAGNKPINSIDLDGAEELEIAHMAALKRDAVLQKPVYKPIQAYSPSLFSQGYRRDSYEANQAETYQRQLAFNKEISERAALDPISYGGPGMGLGLARDPFVQTAATTIATGGITNVASNFMFKTNISSLSLGQQFLLKSSVDLGGQVLFNRPRNVDLFDATLAGLPIKPVFSSLGGAALDIRPFTDNKVSLVGLDKSIVDFGVEATFKYTFGGGGLPGTVKNQYKPSFNLKDATQLKQYDLLNYMMSTPSSLIGKGAAKATKDQINGNKKE